VIPHASYAASCAAEAASEGEGRASIFLRKGLFKGMDCEVKPGNDGVERLPRAPPRTTYPP